jgi:hypothetical protein
VAAYREALVEGEGVLEDLDEATALLAQAREAGATEAELVVFEIPQPPTPGSLPLLSDVPAEGLTLAGWDVIEGIEPFCSALRDAPDPLRRNAFGLLELRADAESLARARNEAGVEDELHAARIWLATP